MWPKIRSFLVHFYRWGNHLLFFIPKKIIIAQYLRKNKVKKLQLGCGTNLMAGWLNTDLYGGLHGRTPVNVTKKLPFRDNTFDYIFNEHLIEHINYRHGQKLIAQCYRILKPSGVIRIATPNLTMLTNLFADNLTAEQQDYLKYSAKNYLGDETLAQPAFILNNFVRNWGHQFIYDQGTIKKLLEQQGFANIKFYQANHSDIPQLSGIERHGEIIGQKYNIIETMAVEATKK